MTTPQRTQDPGERGRARTTLVVLLLTAVAIISVDLTGSGSPARNAVGTVLGPVQTGASRVLSPVGDLGDWFATRGSLSDRNRALEQENAELRTQVNSAEIDRTRLGEYDRLSGLTTAAGVDTVTAHVVGISSAQMFQRTASIDVGTADGIRRDQTVVGPDGLVGRVVSATRSNATVLLIVDDASTVGGRVGGSNELGMLRGDGSLAGAGRLTMTTLDPEALPAEGDAVVSWGSRNGTPYVAGVPIGRVESVTTTPRDQTATVTVAPYVDFSSLDTVGVVVAPHREK